MGDGVSVRVRVCGGGTARHSNANLDTDPRLTEVELEVLAAMVHEGVALMVLLLATIVAAHILPAVILGPRLIVRKYLGSGLG